MKLSAPRVAARYKNKKEVPKTDGSGTTVVYEYSPRQVSNRNKDKADRIERLRGKMGDVRSKYKKDLTSDDPKERLTALAVALIDLTYERVGNETSAKENGHFGVTTWSKEHVSVSGGKATISYTGKSGVKHKKEVSDPKVVGALKKALKGKAKGDRLLCDGDDCLVGASDVNAYLKDFGITAKDIRGLHANEEMLKNLKRVREEGPDLPRERKAKDKILKEEFKKALEEAAKAVGHEASTLKGQYLVPGLEDSFLHDGSIIDKLNKKASLTAYLGPLTFEVLKAGDRIWEVRDPRTGLRYALYFTTPTKALTSRSFASRVVLDSLEARGEEPRTFPVRDFSFAKKAGAFSEYATAKIERDHLLAHQLAAESGLTLEEWQQRAGEKLRGWARQRRFVSEDRVEEEELYEFYSPDAGDRAASMIEEIGLPRLILYLQASGIEPWSTAGFPFGATSICEAATQALKTHLSGESLRSLPKWYEFVARVRVATKSDSEIEDAEDSRLVRKSPKKKPPRRDLQRGRVREKTDRDPDKDQDRKDRSNNYKDAASRIALRFFLSRVTPTQSGRFKAERPDSVVPQYFDSKEDAEAWVEGRESEGEGKVEGDKKPKSKEKEPTPEERREKLLSEASSVTSGDYKESVDAVLRSFDEDELADFLNSLKQNRTQLAQEGPKDAKGFKKQVGEARRLLKSDEDVDPAQLAEAVAAVDYFDGVYNNPFADVDPENGPIPESTKPPSDPKAAKKKLESRAWSSVSRYREMNADQRKDHAEKLSEEIDSLPEGSEKRLHLEAVRKGLAVASAIEDGDDAEGIGAVIAHLTRAAEKGGNLRDLMSLGSVNSKEALGGSDQAVIRKVYEDLTDFEWSELLGKDHPGRELADLLSDPEQSKYLTPDDLAFVRTHLQDMMMAEVAFLDPYVNREVEGKVGDKSQKAQKARAAAVPELSIPKLSDGGLVEKAKEIKSWVEDWASKMAGLLKSPNKRAPEEKSEKAPEKSEKAPEKEHRPGDVWRSKGKFWAKDPTGNAMGFDTEEAAKDWASGEAGGRLRRGFLGYDFTPWGKVGESVSS